MEAKLKTLRVADLRELLQKASVAIPAKSNKSDLIAKVLASPAALQAFESQGSSVPAAKPKAPESSQGGEDDLLAPPEEFDWGSTSTPNGGPAPSASTAEDKTSVSVKPVSSKATASAPSQPEKQSKTQQSSSITNAATPASSGTDVSKVDDEMERRKKRAARFGVPVVEVKTKTAPPSNGAKATPRAAKPQTQTADEAGRLEARAARFGMPTASAAGASPTGQKRARSPAPVDKEEMERRKKRAERFSTGGEAKAQA